MPRERFVIRPGKICTMDKNNVAEQDTLSPIVVEVIRKAPGLFSKTWMVRDVDHDPQGKHLFACNEKYLDPVGMNVIRYRADTPVINDVDINTIKNVIEDIQDNKKIDEKVLNRLKALLTKLEFYNSLSGV